MNKTLSIGLAGFSFIIEEHAYIKLSDYLAALKNSLEKDEADEVMHDIEIRMVEIFRESLGKREVINDIDVEKVIAQIGAPEIINAQEETYFSEAQKPDVTAQKSGKQLFRDPARQRIAGVCAGLAQYFGMDVTVMRIIWAVVFIIGCKFAPLFFFVGLFYIVFWIAMPKAQTAADFLKMQGKPMNFDNLKEESNKLLQFAGSSSQRIGDIYNENRPFISNAGSSVANAIRYIFGGILGFLGISLVLVSFAVFGISTASSGDLNFFENIGFYLQNSNLEYVILILGFLTLFIPGLIFSYLSMKLFSPKTKLNHIGPIIGALMMIWMAFAGFAAYTGFNSKSQFSGRNDESENVAIPVSSSDSLIVEIKKTNIPQNFRSYWGGIYSDKKTVFKRDYPNIDVKRQDAAAPYLIIKKSADGYNLPLNMRTPVEISGNKILLPNYVAYDYKNRFRDYNVEYELVVPKGMKVSEGKDSAGLYIHDEENEKQDDDDDKKENSVVISGDNGGTITINGKKMSKEEGKKAMDSMNIDEDNLKDVNISINNGKKEISIKTK